MKILISYFYKMRFLSRNMIPVSTACFDPKWFHDNKGNDYVYQDSNGVYNGFRYESLAPDSTCNGYCSKSCTETAPGCQFLTKYREQLDRIDFDQMIKDFNKFAEDFKSSVGFSEDPVIVLMVYETPSNPCSERSVLISWFKDHGMTLEEYNERLHL